MTATNSPELTRNDNLRMAWNAALVFLSISSTTRSHVPAHLSFNFPSPQQIRFILGGAGRMEQSLGRKIDTKL